MRFDIDEDYEPPPPEDEYFERAKTSIEEVIAQQRVVTERELKVRLEDDFFPWVVTRALKALVSSGRIVPQGRAGRRGKMETKIFYSLPDFAYDEIVGEMREKRDVSREVVAMLTGQAPATYFAEDVFEKAFRALDFEIIDRDASEYKGRKTIGVAKKEPPNLDFILKRDNVVYGVDIKNWLGYEYSTRAKVTFKVNLALQLGIVPFIVASIRRQGCHVYGNNLKRWPLLSI